eukprot:CAMPEP_0195513676 /NCGR_PEP_ID=MMETSP0794_2-20130614/5271_1 /TAXON_ID=515487 /ORGANISM="Stephanopyxis turris, Strain CCMP 815" /LENGTH=436 /DNA_ID=CAMNT_0040641745 /DNA_START=171 /DNA_END=1481 /DNA_ORIENTATION=+
MIDDYEFGSFPDSAKSTSLGFQNNDDPGRSVWQRLRRKKSNDNQVDTNRNYRVRRGGKVELARTRMNMQSMAALESSSDGIVKVDPNRRVNPLQVISTVLQETRSKLPSLSFPNQKPKALSNEDLSLVLLEENSKAQTTSHMSRFVANALLTRLQTWSTHTLNLSVSSILHAHTFPRLLLKQQLSTDLSITFDRLAFPNIQISGGGRMYINKIIVDLRSMLSKDNESTGRKRFPKSFEFHAQNVVFTQEDILNSTCIRNGLQRLFNRILNRSGLLLKYASKKVTVESVNVLPHGKISCKCIATTTLDTEIPFEVRTGLNVTAQGHILTFPGLEVSLNPMNNIIDFSEYSPIFDEHFGGWIPILPLVNLDIGNHANIEKIQINGMKRQIRVENARVKVTPNENNRARINYRQHRDSYLARYACDLGMWVTNLGNFTR